MVESAAASGLLTASSIMVAGLSFVFDRIEVPREKRAKGTLFLIMCIGYISSLGCLYLVTLPTSGLSDLILAETLFKISIGSMMTFIIMMGVALFPDEAAAILG